MGAGAANAKTVQVTGHAEVPAGATAVALNVTVIQGGTPGFTTVYPADTSAPGVSTVNANAGQVIANAAIVKLSNDGKVKILVQSSADVLLDVVGWYSAASNTWTYTYDADGLRRTKTGPDGTTTYTWDKTNPLIPLLVTETTSTDTTRYIYGPGGTPYEQINPDGSVTYLHRDQLGSTRLLTNNTGTNTGERAYTPYGQPATTTGTATTNFGYAGQYTDSETGYQYLRARFYEPVTANFISRDPLVALTARAYGYVNGSPLNASDPSGLMGEGQCRRNPGAPMCQPRNEGSLVDLVKSVYDGASVLCQSYCDDVANYAGVVAVGAGVSCPLTGVGCVVAGVAAGTSLATSTMHAGFTCADGLDEYCRRSAISTGANWALWGLGKGLSSGAAACLEAVDGGAGERSLLSLFTTGPYELFLSELDTTERPDTRQRHGWE